MEQIGIFGEFFHAGNEYAFRHFSETDYLDDEVIHFDHKAQLRAYLSNLQKDPTTWTVLNTVARNPMQYENRRLRQGGFGLSLRQTPQ